jgi:putative YhdH/YhfP family quinone oxidoreductase
MKIKESFKAYRLTAEPDGSSRGRISESCIDELDAGDLIIKTAYAGVNYKDALAGNGVAKVMQRLPCIGGIEAVGTVISSTSKEFSLGDAVVVHGRGMGVKHDGGFSEYVRVPAARVIHLPANLSMLEAAILGVGGHTAAIAIDMMETNGLSPEKGPVAVTGATGGVGSLAIDMLSARGYEVVAVTRKVEAEPYLLKLGANRVVAAPDKNSHNKPLESAQWAGAIDTTGGYVLSWLLRTMMQHGIIATCGNTAGIEIQTTVLPFILRGVRLLGIDGNTEIPYRKKIWDREASDLKPRHLHDIGKLICLDEVPELFDRMIAGQSRGRQVVEFK